MGQDRGKQPGTVVLSLELVFIKAGGRGAGQTWRRRAGRLEPFSRVLKRAGKGRKNKPRHTLGGCRLARDLGTTSQVPGVEAKAVGTHPRLGRLRSVPQLPLLGMSFYRIWDNSVLFQKDEQHGPEGCISSHVVYEIHVY